MYFKTKASQVFPPAEWTGGSHIHASIARGAAIPHGTSEGRMVVKSMVQNHFGGYVQRTIMKNCPNMEWLLNAEEFEALVIGDYQRMFKGMGAIDTKKKLTNPVSGNQFHRVAMLEDQKIVGGIRVWVLPMGSDSCQIGWRFRLEEQDTESDKVRVKARQLALLLEDVNTDIKEYIKEQTEVSNLVLEDYIAN